MTKSQLRSRASEISDMLSDLLSDAQSTYDDRSEKWQGSDNGDEWLEFIDRIEAAKDELDEVMS